MPELSSKNTRQTIKTGSQINKKSFFKCKYVPNIAQNIILPGNPLQ